MTNRSTRWASRATGEAFRSLCVAAVVVMAGASAASAQAPRRAVGQPAPKPSDAADVAAFAQTSPWRLSGLEANDAVRRVNGAALAADAAGVQSLRQREAVRLMNFVLAPGISVDLDLRRADVFADDAVIRASRLENGVAVWQDLPRPSDPIFVGRTVDDPDSVVAISVSASGVQGLVNRLGETFILSSGSSLTPNAPVVFRLDADAAEALGLTDFSCGADLIPQPMEGGEEGGVAGFDTGDGTPPPPPCRIARVAIETDHEYLQALFGGNTGAATSYAGLLIAAASEVFHRDLNVRFQISFLQLWTSASDPWSSGDTSAQLFQFRDYWQANFEWVDRDVAHFLSGRTLGGGIAWLSSLCEDALDYSLAANLRGSFPYPTLMQSDFNWDIIVVTHELGHNFGSPHTHSYVPPIDGCGSGNCAGASEGTIMSYCHQCPGGLANMHIRFHETCIERILDYLDNETLCNLLDTDGPPDPNNDFEYVAAGVSNRIDVLRNDLSGNCAAPTIASTDALSQMGGTIAISAGTGPNGRDELLYTPAPGFTGNDQFFYWITNGGPTPAGGQVKVNVLPLQPATGPACAEPGLAVAYFELGAMESLPNFAVLTPNGGGIVTDVNVSSTEGNFAGSNQSEHVGAVYEGYLDIPVAAAYRLSVTSDDGSKVWLDGNLVLNNDGLHGMIEKEAPLALDAGLHPLRVEFFENEGGAGLVLGITSVDIVKQAVPASMLRWGGPHAADFVDGATFSPPGDGVVDAADLAYLLGAWGASDADIVNSASFLPPGDHVVDGADLAYLLGAWGGCE